MIESPFKIRVKPNTNLYEVYKTNVGPMPQALKGVFTSQEIASHHIKKYEKLVGERIKPNAKKRRDSTG